MAGKKTIYLRRCDIDGEVLVTTGDFHWHGIKHSNPFVVTPAEYKEIMRQRKAINAKNLANQFATTGRPAIVGIENGQVILDSDKK